MTTTTIVTTLQKSTERTQTTTTSSRLLEPRVIANTAHSICYFFFNDTATTEIYTLSLHDALPISRRGANLAAHRLKLRSRLRDVDVLRSEEHTSELQSQFHLVCRLLLEKKKN